MFYKDKKVVVTGGSGFVGTNFLLELLERGADVTTHTHIRPMEIEDDRINIIENIDLFKLYNFVFKFIFFTRNYLTIKKY